MSAAQQVTIIGGGVIGCAIACELARRGASVDLLDDRPIGMGATQASAGILAPFLEAREGHPLLDLGIRSLALYDELVARASADSGVAIPYCRTGTIDIAADEEQLTALSATAAVLERRGVAARLLDASAARADEPHLAGEVTGALLIEPHGFVGAADLTRALAVAARRHGAHLLEGSRVRRIARRGSEIVLDTNKGTLTCGTVVLAAGTWSGEIAIDGVAPAPVRPVRGQLLSLAWQGAPLRRVTWSSRCYLVPWSDGTVLLGATAEEVGFDERATVEGVRGLLEAACEVVPAARTAGFNAARVGLRPATPDALPIVGFSSTFEGLIYATGHFRNGILLAPLTAQLVGDALIDGREDAMLAALSPARFGAL